jgi:hypothetical protein
VIEVKQKHPIYALQYLGQDIEELNCAISDYVKGFSFCYINHNLVFFTPQTYEIVIDFGDWLVVQTADNFGILSDEYFSKYFEAEVPS